MSCRKDVVIIGLQLWLPLNGDVKNYGLCNAELSYSNLSFEDSGKIGKCLSTGGIVMSAETAGKILNNNAITISLWLYVNAPTGSDNKAMIFGNNEMANNNNRKFSLFQYPTCNDFHYCWMNDTSGDSGTFRNGVVKNVFPSYQWTHIAVTYENPNICVYINGELKHTSSGVSNSASFHYATNVIHNSPYHKVNDFRLYDECLSPKQIKYISQAMICHYPMGNIDGKIGGRNLIRNSKFTNTSWSNNNCGVEIGNTNGSHFDYTTDGIRTVKKSGWGGTGIFIKPDVIPIEYEKTVTLSFDLKLIKFNDIYFSSSANTVGDKNWWTQTVPNTNTGLDVAREDLNNWHRVSCTIKIPAKNSMYEKERVVIIRLLDGSNGGDYEYYMKNLKLELGNIATDWTPTPEDNPPFYDNIIPDISGYQNNGEVTDSACPTWSNDSPRYLGSYEFNGKNQYISGLSPISNNTKEFTIAFWVKLKNVPNVMTFYTARKSIGSGVALFFVNKNIRFDDNAQFAFNYTCNLSSNKWTHLCVTRNNTSKKLYINGKLVDSTSKVGDMQNIGQHFTIGGSESSDSGIADMNWLNGNISDFRIYTTALSESDVLDLYQSSASLDSQGNLILSGEVIE